MLRRILAIMQKEMLHIFRDKIMRSVVLVSPFVLTLLVGFIYSHHKVTNIPIVIFDQDQSDISRSIVRSFGDSERFAIIGDVYTYAEMQRAIETEKAYMGVVIPPNLKKDIKNGRATQVGLALNASNLVLSNTMANAASQIIQTVSGSITMQVMEKYGIAKDKAYQAVTALSFRTRMWYNPTSSYLLFMLLGLIGTVLQQVALLGIAISFSREKENGTWRQLMFSKLNGYEIILGKFLLYFIIFALDAIVMYGLGLFFFSLPMRGDALLTLGTMLLFVVVTLVMGMLISILAKSVSQAIEMSMLLATPSFLVSGFTWPFMSMPEPIKFLSSLLPLTYFLRAIKSEVLMGLGLDVVGKNLLILALFIIICLPLTIVLLNRNMKTA